jgi:hypothetical protein
MKKPMYVSRKVLNGKDIIEWARGQGFKSALAVEALHVTIVYSKEPVDFNNVEAENKNKVTINNGTRSIETFDGGATVLKFQSKVLAKRQKELLALGCSCDYDTYKPHITITFESDGVDVSGVMPYAGVIKLGPEIVEELNENWADENEEEYV